MRSEVSKWLIAGTLSSFLLGACQQNIPAPVANPEVDWEHYYSNSNKEVATEHLQTTDGGFVVIGTRYTANDEGDIIVLKTDQNGVKTWETILSKSNDNSLHYDERGVTIIEKPNNMGYLVVGNRNFIDYSSSTHSKRNTDIVLYELDINGVATNTDGKELNEGNTSSNSGYYDFVAADAALVENGGATQYIIIGHSTLLSFYKPANQFNSAYDKTDAYYALVDASFNHLWAPSSRIYGFNFSDYGHSVYVDNNDFVIIGSIGELDNPNSTATPPLVHQELLTLKINSLAGSPINPQFEGDVQTNYSSAVKACINPTLNRLTEVTVDANNASSLSVFYRNADNLQATPPAPGVPASLVIPVDPPYANAGGSVIPTSINNATGGGVLISFTHTSMMGSNLGIIRLNDAGTVEAGYPYYYGYNSNSTAFNGKSEEAASVTEINDGSIKYVYSGTFEANTSSSRIGLIQLNKSTGL